MAILLRTRKNFPLFKRAYDGIKILMSKWILCFGDSGSQQMMRVSLQAERVDEGGTTRPKSVYVWCSTYFDD
jgi:hypothetical protein